MAQQENSIDKITYNRMLEKRDYGSFEIIRCNQGFNIGEEKYCFGDGSLKLNTTMQLVSQSFEYNSRRDGQLSENSPLLQMSWPPATSSENKSSEFNDHLKRDPLKHVFDKHQEQTLTLLEKIAKVVPCLGIILSLGASFFLGTAGMLVKMTSSVHGIQVAVFRAIFQLFVYGFIIKLKGSPYLPEAREFMPVMCRAFLGASSITFAYCALKLIPLGDATTIRFSLPIWTLILSFLVLNESFSFYKLLAVVLSISGVLFIAKPDDCIYLLNYMLHGFEYNHSEIVNSGSSVTTPTTVGPNVIVNNKEIEKSKSTSNEPFRQLEGSLLALASSICLSISLVALRLCKQTPAEVTILWLSIISIVIGSLSLVILQEWRLPNNRLDVAYIFLNGLCGSIGQWFITSALKIEQSGVISLARTFDIEVAFLYSAFILHENIRITSIVGSVLVSCGVLTVVVPKWLTSRENSGHRNYGPSDNDSQFYRGANNNREDYRNAINRYPHYRSIQVAS